MNSKENFNNLIKNGLWKEIALAYSPEDVAKSQSFKDGLRIAYHLLYNDDWDEDFQQYAVKLLYAIRSAHLNEWNSSWKFDAFLGLACDITYKQGERYEAYKRAFKSAEKPPARLLIEMARCSVCPGTPPISYDKSIELIMTALREAPYADGISLLCNIYSLKNDDEKKVHWSKVLEKMSDAELNFNSPSIEPEFLINERI